MELSRTPLSAREALALCCLVVIVTLAGCSFEYSSSSSDEFALENDPDDDGLNSTLEEEIGTDPQDADTDGDRLPDGWEYRGETPDGAALPDADPLRKDIYVQVVYAEDVEPLTEKESRNIEEMWESMNVSNPDGTQGVTIHLDDGGPHGGTVDVSGELNQIPNNYQRDAYADYVPAERQCVYHQVLYQRIDAEGLDSAGKAGAPGYGTLVAGQKSGSASRNRTIGTYNVRELGLTHELLHNVVGEIGDSGEYHGTEGYLTGEFDPSVDTDEAWSNRYERLSDTVAAQLSAEGFKERIGTTAEGCA